MARRIFISYQHADQMKAKGLNLLRWNRNVDVEFVGRHLLDPVNSGNEPYIRSKILEQLAGTSVTVVLLGSQTYRSTWVQWELEKSVEKGNGILAIRLADNVALPSDSPVGSALKGAAAEIVAWDPHALAAAIERAALAAGRGQAIRAGVGNGRGGCSR